MNSPLKRVLVVAHVVVALVAMLGLGACSRSQHVTDSLTGVARDAGEFKNGVKPPPPPPGAVGVALKQFSLAPTSVGGGASSQGSLRLNSNAPAGGNVVTLTSSDPTVAQVPASITVAAGQSNGSFTVTTVAVATNRTVTITASSGGTSLNASLAVAAPALASVAVAPAAIATGGSSTGTVTLTAAAITGGAVIALTNSAPAVASMPASVTVAAGATTATFAITTVSSLASSSVVVTGTFNGVARTATLTVTAPALASVAVAPAAITAGAGSTGIVTLSLPGGAGGTLVALTSSAPAVASTPASVTVAAGATTATFAITTVPSPLASSVIVTATLAGVARTATLAVAASDPCASVSQLGGTVAVVSGTVPQFRTLRLRTDLVGDVTNNWIDAMGGCATAAVPTVAFVSGTATATLSGTNRSVIPTGASLTFGPLTSPVPAEPGTVLAIDPAGNVLQIIWPLLAGLPAGPPVLRLNMVARTADVATGVSLDVTLTFVALGADGSLATFTATGTNMIVPVFVP